MARQLTALMQGLRCTKLLGVAAALLLSATVRTEAAWEVAHGDTTNSGFADVGTAPAGRGSLSVPGLGGIAPGANPVVGPDGTVYIGTVEGRVVALHADGSAYWRRDIVPAGQAIVASPAVGSDGMVYVVGVKQIGEGAGRRYETRLHPFTTSGGYPGPVLFPDYFDGAITSAPPNIWRFQGREAVIVPTLYPNRLTGGHQLRLVAFAAAGGYLADTVVSTLVPEVTGGGGYSSLQLAACMVPLFGIPACLPPGFSVAGSAPPPRLLPPVAIYTYPGGGTPHIVASDNQHGLWGYTFSPDGGFIKSFGIEDRKRLMQSAPVIGPDGYSMVGQQDIGRDSDGNPDTLGSGAITFGGPKGGYPGPLTGLRPVLAPPTRTIHGHYVAMEAGRGLAILRVNQLLSRTPLAGAALAASASRTHLFVATRDALVTFDGAGQAVLAEFPWVDGGAQRPVIGPQGHVYAIASNILFVFPPPATTPAASVSQGLAVLESGAVLRTSQPAAPAPAPPRRDLHEEDVQGL